jgi:hypothetical protein
LQRLISFKAIDIAKFLKGRGELFKGDIVFFTTLPGANDYFSSIDNILTGLLNVLVR